MSQRFFVDSPIRQEHVTLAGAEAHHLLHVMRAKVGTEIVLFDGSGCEFAGRVEKLGRSTVDVAVIERREVSRELERRVTLAVALPKGDRQKWLVEKATELGVKRLVPLRTERSVAQPVAQTIDRLRKTVVEACKQCGRNRLMQIAEPIDWSALIAEMKQASIRLVAHPGGVRLSRVAWPGDSSTNDSTDELIAAVGPEGGFSEAEVEFALQNGWQSVSLGESILRIETAALAIAAWSALR